MLGHTVLDTEQICSFRRQVTSSESFRRLGFTIRRGNRFDYERVLRETLEDVSGQLYSLLGIENNQISECYMTFHYSSAFTKSWHRNYLSPIKRPLLDIKREFFDPNRDYHTYEAYGRSYETHPKFFNLPMMDGVTEPITLIFSRDLKKSAYNERTSTLYISEPIWCRLYSISQEREEVERLFFKGEELASDGLKELKALINALGKIVLVKKDDGRALTLMNLAKAFAQNNTPDGKPQDFIITSFFSTFIYSIWNYNHNDGKPLTIVIVPSLLPSVHAADSSVLQTRWWEAFPKLAALNLAYKLDYFHRCLFGLFFENSVKLYTTSCIC